MISAFCRNHTCNKIEIQFSTHTADLINLFEHRWNAIFAVLLEKGFWRSTFKCYTVFMKLLIASRNIHKIREIRAIFHLDSLEIIGADDLPDLPDVIEDGQTFQSNAIKKAVTLALSSKLWTLADDSGLEVDVLGGAPGVCSARYAGEHGNYAANNAKVLKELEGKTIRTARFCCVVALSSPSGRAQTVEGICRGRLIHEERGAHGFGYDPLFVPDDYSLTFSELVPSIKNQISHRARALKKAMELWGEMLILSVSDWPLRTGLTILDDT